MTVNLRFSVSMVVNYKYHSIKIELFFFDFNDICAGLYGPGYYISLASNFHTFIINNVPY
jgi:predicted ATPase